MIFSQKSTCDCSYIHTIITSFTIRVFDHTLLLKEDQMLDSLEKKSSKMPFKVLIFTIIYLSLWLQLLLEAIKRKGLTLVTHSCDSIRSAPVCYCMYRAISQTTVNPKHWDSLSKLFSHIHLLQNLRLLGPSDLRSSSDLSVRFNYKTLPPCKPVTYHVERLRVWTAQFRRASEDMYVFVHFTCHRVSKDLLILQNKCL